MHINCAPYSLYPALYITEKWTGHQLETCWESIPDRDQYNRCCQTMPKAYQRTFVALIILKDKSVPCSSGKLITTWILLISWGYHFCLGHEWDSGLCTAVFGWGQNSRDTAVHSNGRSFFDGLNAKNPIEGEVKKKAFRLPYYSRGSRFVFKQVCMCNFKINCVIDIHAVAEGQLSWLHWWLGEGGNGKRGIYNNSEEENVSQSTDFGGPQDHW